MLAMVWREVGNVRVDAAISFVTRHGVGLGTRRRMVYWFGLGSGGDELIGSRGHGEREVGCCSCRECARLYSETGTAASWDTWRGVDGSSLRRGHQTTVGGLNKSAAYAEAAAD